MNNDQYGYPAELWHRFDEDLRAEVVAGLVSDGAITDREGLMVSESTALPPKLAAAFQTRRAAVLGGGPGNFHDHCLHRCEALAERAYRICASQLEEGEDDGHCDLEAVAEYEGCAAGCDEEGLHG